MIEKGAFSPEYDSGIKTDSTEKARVPEYTQSENLSKDDREEDPRYALSKLYGISKPYRVIVRARIIP